MCKILLIFEIKMLHSILARRSDLVFLNNKRRLSHLVYFAIQPCHKVKMKESEQIDKYLNLASELKKAVEHEGDWDTKCGWNGSQSLERKLEELEIRTTI